MAFIKLLSRSMNHNGLQYQAGYVQDFRKFEPTTTCGPGGIYFCEEKHAYMWTALYGTDLEYVCTVSLPREAQVAKVGRGKWKADAVILGPPIPISYWLASVDQELAFNCILHNPYLLTKVPQTEDLCVRVLQYNKYAYKYIREKTSRVLRVAICDSA